jgi:ABC-type polysaccharide/polyol phosphate transport system ATPase subunit
LVKSEPESNDNLAVFLKDITCKWISAENIKEEAFKKSMKKPMKKTEESPEDTSPPTLNNITIEIPKGKLYGICGHVGSGKSSLLQVILKELQPQSGSLCIRGKLAYA